MIALINTFLRSFFLQTLWNFERMQNIGFAFGIAPLLKRATTSREGYIGALRRHTHFFNTHPYFSTIVMGVAYHKEKNRSAALKGDDPTLTVLKDSMGAAFGGIGDHVLWGTWRPFCATLAIGIGLLVAYPMMSVPTPEQLLNPAAAAVSAKWWVAGFLGLFNAVHLWLRWRGLQRAAADGPLVVKWVQSLSLQTWAAQTRRVGLLLLMVMILFYLSRWRSSDLLLWMVAVLLGTIILKRWAWNGVTLFYLVVGASVAMAWLGVQWS
jgi:mannose/fructose/N-acetylgalactosamine-specific phosphotransferase system component IID